MLDMFGSTQCTIRNNIRKERKKCGYTQEDIAKVLGISLSLYRKLEQGQRKFTLDYIILISNFLNIELPSLFRLQVNDKDILNQDELSRKEFLIEFLKTFGIGSSPQMEYTLRDISALISFIRAYGHSVPYCPKKLKHHLMYDGTTSHQIFEKVEELAELYEKDMPKKCQEVEKLIRKEATLKAECNILEKELEQLYQVKLAEVSPEIEELEDKILSNTMHLFELDEEIETKNELLSSLKEKNNLLEKSVNIAKKTLKEIEHKAINTLSTNNKLLSTTESVTLEMKCISLEIENAELQSELDSAYEIIDKYESEQDEMNQIDKNHQINDALGELIEDEYHNIDGEALEDIISLLLTYAQAFEILTNKYKTSSKNINTYIKNPDFDFTNIDYSSITSPKYISHYVQEKIKWESTSDCHYRDHATDD